MTRIASGSPEAFTVPLTITVIASGEPEAIRVNREVQQAYLGEEGEDGAVAHRPTLHGEQAA